MTTTCGASWRPDPDGVPLVCVREQHHPLPHRDVNGVEWIAAPLDETFSGDSPSRGAAADQVDDSQDPPEP